MSQPTSAQSIGLCLSGLPGKGRSYALLALQVTARSDLNLSIVTVPDTEGHAEPRSLTYYAVGGDAGFLSPTCASKRRVIPLAFSTLQQVNHREFPRATLLGPGL